MNIQILKERKLLLDRINLLIIQMEVGNLLIIMQEKIKN